jgi:hypothetical protein
VTQASQRAQREVERRFPVRIRIAVPPDGFGRQLAVMHAWLDETCSPDGWATAPAGLGGVVNDAVAFYFADAAFGHAFVNRFCCGYRVEAVAGAFRLRSDAPPPRHGTAIHKTP